MSKILMCERCKKTYDNLLEYKNMINIRGHQYSDITRINLSICDLNVDICKDCLLDLKLKWLGGLNE